MYPVTPANKGPNSPAPLAFFIPGLNGGGAQRVFVTLVNTLVDMTDHPIHLVTSRAGGAFEGLVDKRVVRVVLGQERVSRSILPLARYIRAERPAAVVSTLDYSNVVFLLATIVARVPLRKVIREANVLMDDPVPVFGRLMRIMMRTLMRFSYRYADDLIIITEDIARSLIANRIGDIDKMRRIPNPVSLDRLRMQQDAAHKELLDCESFILGAGRLSHQKGFDTLIRAFAQLKRADINLVLLGEGPLQSALEALSESLGVRHRVIFLGFVPNPFPIFKQASLFVLSSRWEGFANVLVEALASGTPIVSTDCPGSAREVLQGGRLGRLVLEASPPELAAAIEQELISPTADSKQRMARAADFTAKRIAQEYLNVLLGIRNRPGPHSRASAPAPTANEGSTMPKPPLSLGRKRFIDAHAWLPTTDCGSS